MLAALLTPAVITAIITGGMGALKDFQDRKITIAQLANQLAIITRQEITKVEQANAQALQATYGTFMSAMVNVKTVRIVWAIVVLSQLTVLVWEQAGVPALAWFYPNHPFPSNGDLTKWAYALIAFCLGAGPIIMKTSATVQPKKEV